MIHEKFKLAFSDKDRTSEYKKLLVLKATKIIAISQCTKNDLIELFNVLDIEILFLDTIFLL